MRRPLRLALALALALTTTACGWIVGEITQQIHRQSALKDQVYTQELPTLWREVRDLWTSYGCELSEEPKLGETIACEADKRWLRVDARKGGHKVEIEVERTRAEAEGGTSLVRERDWELEWKLLERVDPDTARRIESEAKAKGAKAKDAARLIEDSIEDNKAGH